MTAKEQKKFSRRFSSSDWQHLCGKLAFLEALDKSEAEAEVVAYQILTEQEPKRET